MKQSVDAVEAFLYHEAQLLDKWRLQEWADLFTVDGRYLVAPLNIQDPENADPELTLFLIADDHSRIQARVERLMKKSAVAEHPRSRTRHTITNVIISKHDSAELLAECNFVTFRVRNNEIVTYMGRSYYTISTPDEKYRIREKRVCLDLQFIGPQGGLSILL